MMSQLEVDFMPEFKSYHQLYIEIRNLICLHWQRDLRTYLTFDAFLTRSRLDTAKLRHCAKRVFDFLNLHGYINSGLLPIAEGAGKQTRPSEQRRPIQTEAHTPLVRRKSAEVPPVKQEETKDANGDVAMKTEGEPFTPVKSEPPSSSPSTKRVIIIGAGASGLAAARQMQSFGHEVVVLEGRDRVGGRAHTMRNKFSAPVDLGASIMTGLYGSPLNVLSKQITQSEWTVGLSTKEVLGRDTVLSPAKPFPALMHYIRPNCQLYTSSGKKADAEMDTRMENLWNKLLETEHALKQSAGIECEEPQERLLSDEERAKIKLPPGTDIKQMSVEDGVQLARKQLGVRLSKEEERLLDWHAANLEYGCATALNRLSLVYWDQDDGMAWEGDHALIKPGFGTFVEHLSHDVDIRYQQHVLSITYPDENGPSTSSPPVEVRTRDNLTGEERTLTGDYVLCTASLGVLKTNTLSFTPALPAWKQDAITSLGFGCLNKLILEWSTPWWKEKNDHDMFGYTPASSTVVSGGEDEQKDGSAAEIAAGRANKQRGKFYIFWNLERSTGKPILAALCAGEAAYSMESESEESLTAECMRALRSIHAPLVIPDPILTHQTKWSQDQYARGSYSFLAAGNNGKEYDILAKPVGEALYFAGEACNRDYPATVPGAYLSGLRAAGLMQSHCFAWDKENPSSAVLRELSKQATSFKPKGQALASSLTHQAAQEIYRQGGDDADEGGLQRKIAEILARHSKRNRRGIREMVVERVDLEGEGGKTAEQKEEENIKSKLEAAARMLKAGLYAAKPLQSITVPLPPSNSRYAHIKSVDGPMDRPFDARKHDNAGLPTVASFDEFEGAMAPTDKHRSAEDRREKHRRDAARHEKKRRASSKDKKHDKSSSHKRSKHSASHKSGASNSASAAVTSSQPEVLIHRQVGKILLRLTSALPGGADANRSLLKQVHRKAGAKVLEDWKSKQRGKLTVAEWMGDKRKEKIVQLCEKYLKVSVQRYTRE
jgi:monoamine oxidase